GIRDFHVTGVQTCALPICPPGVRGRSRRVLAGWYQTRVFGPTCTGGVARTRRGTSGIGRSVVAQGELGAARDAAQVPPLLRLALDLVDAPADGGRHGRGDLELAARHDGDAVVAHGGTAERLLGRPGRPGGAATDGEGLTGAGDRVAEGVPLGLALEDDGLPADGPHQLSAFAGPLMVIP